MKKLLILLPLMISLACSPTGNVADQNKVASNPHPAWLINKWGIEQIKMDDESNLGEQQLQFIEALKQRAYLELRSDGKFTFNLLAKERAGTWEWNSVTQVLSTTEVGGEKKDYPITRGDDNQIFVYVADPESGGTMTMVPKF